MRPATEQEARLNLVEVAGLLTELRDLRVLNAQLRAALGLVVYAHGGRVTFSPQQLSEFDPKRYIFQTESVPGGNGLIFRLVAK